MPSFHVLHHLLDLLKLMSIESMMPSNLLILCRPLFLLSSVFLSIRVFSKESALHIRWPKNWSFSSSISPSNEYSGLIPFRIDRFDLLAVQGTVKNFIQHHSLKAPILQHSAFFQGSMLYREISLARHSAWKSALSCVCMKSFICNIKRKISIGDKHQFPHSIASLYKIFF